MSIFRLFLKISKSMRNGSKSFVTRFFVTCVTIFTGKIFKTSLQIDITYIDSLLQESSNMNGFPFITYGDTMKLGGDREADVASKRMVSNYFLKSICLAAH